MLQRPTNKVLDGRVELKTRRRSHDGYSWQPSSRSPIEGSHIALDTRQHSTESLVK
jgi:hypothetical protein